jgi:cobalt-zinc-cadmium efflux system membrane fusion protein
VKPARTHRVAAGLALLALFAGCKPGDGRHEHASDHPPGHDHHAKRHGHGEMPVARITRWTDRLELFAEHRVALAGTDVDLLVQITVLDGFRPLEGAELILELEGPAALRAEARQPVRPGSYELPFVPPAPGIYRGRLSVSGSVIDMLDDLIFEVFATTEEARASVQEEEEEERYIELLKEQQWGVPFASAAVAEGALVASIEVAGTVATPPGGSAEIGAPIAGRIAPPPEGLPRPGETVRAGQELAMLAPAPASPEEAARASLTVAEAEARVARARKAAARAERLIRDQAIPRRDVEDARREVVVAEEALRAARNADRFFTGSVAGSGGASWKLVSPIDGTLVEVAATPGAVVTAGSVLFRVVDTLELWIRARVPEQEAPRLRGDRDASFRIAGLEDSLPIRVSGNGANASLVTIGRTVDPISRTVDVIYSLHDPDPRLLLGGLVRLSIPAGDDFKGVVAPRSAIVDDDGREVVYVQVDGEHFEERLVRTGPRQGNLVAVLQGLEGDERIVVRGAHVVRLAARRTSSEPHGHIH